MVTQPPRKPTDRLPKADVVKASELPAGWETMRPVIELRSGELANVNADLLALFESIGVDMENPGESAELKPSADVLRAIGGMATVLEAYASDVPAFIKLDTGPGAQSRVMDLAMWYLAELGKSESSTD